MFHLTASAHPMTDFTGPSVCDAHGATNRLMGTQKVGLFASGAKIYGVWSPFVTWFEHQTQLIHAGFS